MVNHYRNPKSGTPSAVRNASSGTSTNPPAAGGNHRVIEAHGEVTNGVVRKTAAKRARVQQVGQDGERVVNPYTPLKPCVVVDGRVQAAGQRPQVRVSRGFPGWVGSTTS